MNDQPKPGRGGKRPGAGRPRLSVEGALRKKRNWLESIIAAVVESFESEVKP